MTLAAGVLASVIVARSSGWCWTTEAAV